MEEKKKQRKLRKKTKEIKKPEDSLCENFQ
jgi:hypothetical protein